MNSTLSSANVIQDIVQRGTNGFDFINTIGSFINNTEFATGYRDLRSGRHTSQSFIWEALSAIGQTCGEQMYSSVLHYIDNVSNIDTCRLQALKSMMQNVKMDYGLFDKLNYYPLELRALLDILSIGRDYLLRNEFLKNDFINWLSASGVLISSYDVHALSSEIAAGVKFTYDIGQFDAYIENLISCFIYDMLCMTDAIGEPVYRSLTGIYVAGQYRIESPYETYGEFKNEFVDIYDDQRRQYGVSPSFNPYAKLNDIELGHDDLDNYSGTELDILLQEKTRRESQIDRNAPISALNLLRYKYYKKIKVIEFAEFVDESYILPDQLLSTCVYRYDPNFLEMPAHASKYVINISAASSKDSDPSDVLNLEMIASVAKGLAHVTRYVREIRERVKLQARKIYSKGTNNLMRFVVNEFLVDYANNLKHAITDETILAALSDILDKCSEHDLTKVAVQEYWDCTEYMNISANTTQYATSPHLTNGRYFDEYIAQTNTGLLTAVKQPDYFPLEDLHRFYLSSMGLGTRRLVQQTKDEDVQELYKFLSVLYDIAADASYISKATGEFGTVIDGNITGNRTEDLERLIEISAATAWQSERCGVKFDSTKTLGQQCEQYADKMDRYLTDCYLSSVSSVYDQHIGYLNAMSAALNAQIADLNEFMAGTYKYYFEKSTNKYCYNDDGVYERDYLIGTDAYNENDYYIVRLNQIKDWINAENHCRNWPILCASIKLRDSYNDLHGRIYGELIDQLAPSGLYDIPNDDLQFKLDMVNEFLNTRITQRQTYLQDALDNLRAQAMAIKSEYTGLEQQLNSAIAMLPDTSQGFGYKYAGAKSGSYSGRSNYVAGRSQSLYDMYSGWYFTPKSGGDFSKISFSSITADNFSDKLGQAITLVKQLGQVFFGSKSAFNVAASESAFTAIRSSYGSLDARMDSIIEQAIQLFGLQDMTELTDLSSISVNPVEDRIVQLISLLGTSITEQNFRGDSVISGYYEYLKYISEISVDWTDDNKLYQDIWMEFETYLSGFSYPGSYQVFKPSNLELLYDFTVQRDTENLNVINDWLNNQSEKYTAACNDFSVYCTEEIALMQSANSLDMFVYEYTGDVLEECILDLRGKLIDDAGFRRQYQGMTVENEIQTYVGYLENSVIETNGVASLYWKYLRDRVGTYRDSGVRVPTEFDRDLLAMSGRTWFDLMQDLYDELNYRDDTRYANAEKMFKTYSGVYEAGDPARRVAHDPYYNLKNQTHPSYQIHPFMWKFVEKHEYTDSLSKNQYVVKNLNIDDLELDRVAGKIDSYIGEFGQIVDVWKHSVCDYTGYMSRYEKSEHISRYTNKYSEVVDYDGAFYPPALEEYLNGDRVLSSSMYKYYRHLDIDRSISEKAYDFVQSLLSDEAAFDAIQEIVKTDEPSSGYDIFKYQVDSFGNTYILYKRYNDASPTYEQKLNTPGRLFIRPADSPIGFPFESVIDSEHSIPNFKSYRIYDMEMTETQTKIVFAFSQDNSSINRLIIPAYIHYDLIGESGIGMVRLTTGEDDCNITESVIRPLPSQVSSDTRLAYYLGMFQQSSTKVGALYIMDELSAGIDLGTPAENPCVLIYMVDSGNEQIDTPSNYTLQISGISRVQTTNGIAGARPVFSKYLANNGDSVLDIAFITDLTAYDLITYKDRPVDAMENTFGSRYDDPSDDEMNSHDIFEQDITVAQIVFGKTPTYQKYNINADLGYIPAYPGLAENKILDISREIDDVYQSVTLLGRSKNLDAVATASAKSSMLDPYATKEDLISSALFGRVFEDYDISQDNSLNIFGNAAMFPNMESTQEYKYGQLPQYNAAGYTWTIDLTDIYAEEDLPKLNLLVYNTATFGKNPYFLTDFSTLLNGKTIYADYAESTDYIATEYELNLNGKTAKFTGTNNGVDETNAYSSNHIVNVSGIDIRFDRRPSGRIRLILSFCLADPEFITYIAENTVKVVLINQHDIRSFEQYHYLDPAGIVSSIMDNGKTVSAWTAANKTFGVNAVALSDYMSLSDVCDLSGSEGLQFKYSEEDVFPGNDLNYYFHSVNTKYPYTVGQYYADMFINGYVAVDPADLIRIFNDNEVYVLNPQDSGLLSSLENVEVLDPNMEVGEFRVYEDYLSTYISPDGVEHPLSEKYSKYDPNFYQYVHMVCVSSDTGLSTDTHVYADLSSGLSVSDEYVKNITIDYENHGQAFGADGFSQCMQASGLYTMKGEAEFGTVQKYSIFGFMNLDEEECGEFLNAVQKFLRLYFAYKKTPSGIVIYANYQNYINSPFVEYRDGHAYQSVISNTYAVIPPDESRMLDVVIQMRLISGGEITGLKNIHVARYEIFNVSDDKPKFVIRKQSSLILDNEITDSTELSAKIIAEKRTETLSLDESGSIDTRKTYMYNIHLNYDSNFSGSVSCTVVFNTNYAAIVDQPTPGMTRIGPQTAALVFQNTIREISIPITVSQRVESKYLFNKPGVVAIMSSRSDSLENIVAENGFIRWVQPKFRLTLVPGSGLPDQVIEIEHGTSIKLPEITRPGYTIEGWYTTPSAGIPIDPTSINGDLTAYAHWINGVYNVSISSDIGDLPPDQTYQFGERSVLVFQAPAADGQIVDAYTVFGANGNVTLKNSTSKLSVIIEPETYGDIVVAPVWSGKVYTVTYKAQTGIGVAGSVPSQTKHHGETIRLAISGFTRTGYLLAGWTTSKTPTDKITYVLAGNYSADANITLYPVWDRQRYTITYSAGNFASGQNLTQIKDFSESIRLRTDGFTRDGFRLAGWSTDPNGLEKSYDLGSLYAINKNVKLYPYWISI